MTKTPTPKTRKTSAPPPELPPELPPKIGIASQLAKMEIGETHLLRLVCAVFSIPPQRTADAQARTKLRYEWRRISTRPVTYAYGVMREGHKYPTCTLAYVWRAPGRKTLWRWTLTTRSRADFTADKAAEPLGQEESWRGAILATERALVEQLANQAAGLVSVTSDQ